MLQRDQLADDPSQGHADQVRARERMGIEHADRVCGQVVERVGRIPRHDRRRATGVALVVADDVTTATGQLFAERRGPPEHRRPAAHDQEHGGMRRIAEGLGGDVEPLRVDDAFAHGSLRPFDQHGLPAGVATRGGGERDEPLGPHGRTALIQGSRSVVPQYRHRPRSDVTACALGSK